MRARDGSEDHGASPSPETAMRLTVDQILDAVEARYPTQRGEWVFFRELRVGVGWAVGAEQRLDAWAMNLWPSKGFQRLAFEVKVSRSDFLREKKKPGKRDAGFLVSNRFYFVAPVKLIGTNEVPEDCGLIEISSNGLAVVVVPAPWRDVGLPPLGFVGSIARRGYRIEKART